MTHARLRLGPGTPSPSQVPVRSLFANKRGILFAVPGAFTPTCSKVRVQLALRRRLSPGAPKTLNPRPHVSLVHLVAPAQLRAGPRKAEGDWHRRGCLCCNERPVRAPAPTPLSSCHHLRVVCAHPVLTHCHCPSWIMHAWGEAQGALGKVRMLSDSDGSLTKALGQEKPSSGALTRSKRYSMVIVDNKVIAFNDGEANGAECTMAGALIASLPALLAKAGSDPLEAFCATDPSADECRVYSD